MFRRIRVVFSKHKPAPGERSYSTVALGALEQLIRLADKAQIPLVGGGFGIIKELIDISHTAKGNQSELKNLLMTISRYSESIWLVVQAMTPEYLRESHDVQAVIARDAIWTFGKDLDAIRATIMQHTQPGAVRKLVLSSALKDDISGWEKQLDMAYRTFQDSKVTILLAGRVQDTHSRDFDGDLNIFGARPMRSYDIGTTGLRFLLDWREQDRTSPWKDLRVGVVQQEQRLVKLYDGPYTEAEEAFLRDVKALGKLAHPNFLSVQGYCQKSSIPFIVFNSGPVNSLQMCLFELALSDQISISERISTMVADSYHAASYVIEKTGPRYNCRHLLERALENAMVDKAGKTVLYPDFDLVKIIEKGRSHALRSMRSSWLNETGSEKPRPLHDLRLMLIPALRAATQSSLAEHPRSSTNLTKPLVSRAKLYTTLERDSGTKPTPEERAMTGTSTICTNFLPSAIPAIINGDVWLMKSDRHKEPVFLCNLFMDWGLTNDFTSLSAGCGHPTWKIMPTTQDDRRNNVIARFSGKASPELSTLRELDDWYCRPQWPQCKPLPLLEVKDSLRTGEIQAFRKLARRIGRVYGVPPEDLCLAVRSGGGFILQTLCPLGLLWRHPGRPLYLLVCRSKTRPDSGYQAYYSLSPDPHHEATQEQKLMVSSLKTKAECAHRPWRSSQLSHGRDRKLHFIQLETHEFLDETPEENLFWHAQERKVRASSLRVNGPLWAAEEEKVATLAKEVSKASLSEKGNNHTRG